MKKIFLSLLMLIVAAPAIYAQMQYVEFKLTAASDNTDRGTLKVYHMDGNSRTEMNMVIPQMPQAASTHTILVLKDEPKKIYQLNEKEKTYAEIVLPNTEKKEADQDKYEVVPVGKEKINGFNTTHVIVKVAGKDYNEELWLSQDVANYAAFKHIPTSYTNDNLYKSLVEHNADGFPVRIKTTEHGRDMQMELTKYETKASDLSLFSLAAYKKDAAATDPNGVNDLMKKMQNMTPEERQKFIDQMRQQHMGNTGGNQ